jgi:signal transduction histidine kinase
LTAAGTRALLEAPLWHGSDQLAVLFFHAPEPRRWTDHEITTLREVARDLAAAIQKASDQEARLRAQVALEASEKRLRLALAAGRMSCWECDLASEVITYTSALNFSSTLPPASLGELIGRIHEEDRPHVAECLRMAREGGGAFHVEYRMTVPGGSHQWIETRAEAHRDHTGRWSRIIGVSSDVSERRQSEEALRHRQKLEGLGVLAGGVAHDFNNLLTGILGNATLATEMMEQNHPARVLVDDVCLASERAAELTRQLLAYAGKGRYVLAPLNLSSLVQDTCRLIQLSIPKKAALRLNLSDDMPSVDADRGQLQQIVMNLVLNAGEAAANRETPEIRVSTRVAEIDRARLRRMAPATGIEPGTYVVLSVEDNGSGMDEATKAKIFDPFFTTKATGRGLGLAAVHGIVRAHHGALSVTSAPDCGTVFEVLFPVSEAYAERSALRRGALRKAVLVVDADEPPRLRAAEILAEAGYDALVAEDAQSAAEALRGRDDVVAVLMDAATAAGALPEMRKVQPGVPVLLSCASGEPDSVHSAGFVPKPFSTSTLLSKLEALTNTAVAAAASADGVPAADLRSPNKNQA